MAVSFPESPIVISVCITIAVAMTIRQDLQLAPIAERQQSAVMGDLDRIPEGSPTLRGIYSLQTPTKDLLLRPSGQLIRHIRETNDSDVKEGLDDRGVTLTMTVDSTTPDKDVKVIGGHNILHLNDEKREPEQSNDEAKTVGGEAPEDSGHKPRRGPIGGLLIGAKKLIHTTITIPITTAIESIRQLRIERHRQT
ncbi:uncharacterized protein LOC126267284 [Schistocerca gregaria]|uniref:uncharacterized protein LOC126267284 n=1 Tax=Schistocerca gregaria TaxID=7010 RepID=UPI00211F38C6|nr:uncharacterized protein LOC126267284 [Schistocerca gregaria]